MTGTLPTVQDVRESVLRRGQAISGWLGQLYILYIVLIVLYVLGALAGLLGASSLAALEGPGGMLAGLAPGLLLTTLPGLVVSLLYLWAIRAAQGALGSVRNVAGADQLSPGVPAQIGRFMAWLTAGQWISVVGALLSVLIAFGTMRSFSDLSGSSGSGLTLVSTLPDIVSGIVFAILSWLIFGAVKAFFGAVLGRVQGNAVAVTPLATRAATWLQFVYVVQWIAVALLGLSVLLGAFGLMLARNSAQTPPIMGSSLLLLIPVVAFYAWLLSLGIRLTGHSRLFALEVGRQLDQPSIPGGLAVTPDPWSTPTA